MAIFQSFQAPQPTFIYRTLLYRAKVAGTGYSLEDILEEVVKIDEATNTVISSQWFNVTTNLVMATAPTLADLHAYDGHRITLASENLTVGATAVTLAAIPANANHAEIHVWGATTSDYVTLTIDGTVPAVNNGFRQSDGLTFELESITELSALQALASNNVVLHVQYFYQSKRNA